MNKTHEEFLKEIKETTSLPARTRDALSEQDAKLGVNE